MDLNFRIIEKRGSNKVFDRLQKKYRRTSTAHRGQHKTQRGAGLFIVVGLKNSLRSPKTLHQGRELTPVVQAVDFQSNRQMALLDAPRLKCARRPPRERARAKELADLRNCTGKPQRFSGIFRCWGAQPTDARRSLTRQRGARIPHSFRPKCASIARGRFKRRTTDSAGQEASPGPFPGSRPPSHSIRAGLVSSTLPTRRQLGSASCSNTPYPLHCATPCSGRAGGGHGAPHPLSGHGYLTPVPLPKFHPRARTLILPCESDADLARS